jgi:alkylhydroperoxidase/carboxymuconolactone decarboxylase family protein YurZ
LVKENPDIKKGVKIMAEKCVTEKNDILIAIGAATAANCIPCFEHLYEIAVASGITGAEIRKAADIAGRVKSGAHKAISGSIDELTESTGAGDRAFGNPAGVSCCG